MKYCLLFLSIIFITISACEKVETPKSDDETLRDTKWRVDTATVSFPLYKNASDLYPSGYDTIYAWQDTFPSCKKDDYIVFRETNIGGIITGDEKCPNGEVAEVEFTWGLTDKSSKLYFYGAKDLFWGFDNVNAKVKELSDSKLIFTFERYRAVQPVSGWIRNDTMWYTVTMEKK